MKEFWAKYKRNIKGGLGFGIGIGLLSFLALGIEAGAWKLGAAIGFTLFLAMFPFGVSFVKKDEGDK